MADLPRRFGPFVLLERLGDGASSAVYLARSADGPGALLVVKCLHRHLYDDARTVARFKHEAAMAVRIDSPFLARAHALGAVDGQLYIAMAYIAGSPLGAILRSLHARRQMIPVQDAVHIACDLLRGLGALHEARDPETGEELGFVHRDVAPKNVIITEAKRAVLVDLGVGKSNRQSWRTATGVLVGTPGYMSPEQLVGTTVDHRADLYAVGVVLWETLTLRRFVPRGSLTDMLRHAASAPFVPPSRLRPEVSPVLDAAVERALEREADARYPTASSFVAALEGVTRTAADLDDAFASMEDILAETTIRPHPELDLAFEDRTEVMPTVEVYATSDVFESTARDGAQTTLVPPRAPPPTRWIVALVGCALLFGLLGIFVGTRLSRSPETTVVRSSASTPPRAVATASVTARASAATPRAVATASVTAAAPVEEARPPVRSARPKRSAARDGGAVPSDPKTTLERRSASLLRRAQELKRRRPALGPRIDLLVGDISRERMSTAPKDALDRLDRLAGQLEALEALPKADASN